MSMQAHKLQLKLYATPESAKAVEPEALIPVFHRWIKDRVLPEMVIDVANYGHVPEGPGVVLIGHGSDYFMDEGEGRLGLLHNRKRSGPPAGERLSDAARRTLYAAALLEKEAALGGKLKFATNELLFRVNDRLAAPNTDATFASLEGELQALGKQLFAGPFELARVGGTKELFAVRFISKGPAGVSVATLLERAGGPPAADASLIG
jgi:hypothetical protein